MKKIYEKIKEILFGEYQGIFVLLFLEILLNITIKPIRYDDAFFIKSFTENSILSFVSYRYLTWTSRVLIEATLGIIFKVSGILWIIVNILLFTLMGYSISKLFVKDNKKQMNLMILWLLLLYPYERMSGAGWGATTVNYIWPLSLGLFSLISIRKMWDKEKIKIIPGFLYILSLIYSCNQELCCGVLVVTFFLFAIILSLRDGIKVNKLIFIEVFISIASLIFIFTTPGNVVRKMEETVNYFPDYMSLSIIEKLITGFTSTIGELVANYSITFAVFTFMIAIMIYTIYTDKLIRAIGFIPFVTTMIFSYLSPITNNFYSFRIIREDFLKEQVLIVSKNYSYIGSYINLIISLLVIISIFLSLCLIFNKIKNNIAFYIFGCGLVTRLTLAFSPTLFISRNRTFIIMEIACLICTLLIWQEFTKKGDKKIKQRVYNSIVFLSILQYIASLSFVLITHIGV
ncbi:MAG: hypothetical protein IKM97_01090 [Clostridia bacterium]|nr:hypothetical protein [Clostridia bacterium]